MHVTQIFFHFALSLTVSEVSTFTSLYQHDQACNEYNELDSNLKEMSTNSFKCKIRLKSKLPNSWYYLGDRKLSILHSRLRIKCSSLNGDLLKMRIVDSLKCQFVHDSESTFHYI